MIRTRSQSREPRRSARALLPAIAAAIALATASAADGAILSGRVVSPSGLGVGGVDVDVDDAVTGERIPTTADTTDPDGTFDVIVPSGVFHVILNAPKAARLVSRTIRGVDTRFGDVDLGTIRLEAGVLLSGRAFRFSNGSPVANADTDVDDSFTGERIPTPDDDTDGAGFFSVVVPVGTIDFTIEPQKADRLVAARLTGIVLGGDANLGDLGLASGVLVSGTVNGPGGGLSGVDIDAYDASTGALLPTPDSTSVAGGSYSFVVPQGTLTIKASAPLATGTSRTVVPNVGVFGNVSLPIGVFPSELSVSFANAGRIVLAGRVFEATLSLRNNAGAPRTIGAVVRAVDPRRGASRAVVGPLVKTIPGSAVVRSGLVRIRIPADVPPALRNIPFHLVALIYDPSSGATVDTDFLAFEVR